MPQDSEHKGATPTEAETSADSPATRRLERHLLEFLVCPLRKTTLIYDTKAQELISPAAFLAFPIKDGVPLLIESCARELSEQDLRTHRIKS
ncbi:MAG: Trm112 family protein [Pseudomonadota bacterium]